MATDKTIIFHNARCSKSREAMNYLEDQHCEIEVIDYLKGISKAQLQDVINMIGIKPEELVRKGETIFKENYKGQTFTDDEWIDLMVKHPVLIERPIVIQNGKAVIGRPVQKVVELVTNVKWYLSKLSFRQLQQIYK